MSFKIETQGTLQVSSVDDPLLTWLEAFLMNRKAAGIGECYSFAFISSRSWRLRFRVRQRSSRLAR